MRLVSVALAAVLTVQGLANFHTGTSLTRITASVVLELPLLAVVVAALVDLVVLVKDITNLQGQAAPEVLVQAAVPMLVLVALVVPVELVVHSVLVVVQAALATLEATETSAMVQPVQPVALAVQPVTT